MGDVVQTEGHALLKAVSQGKLRLARLLLEGGAYINEGNERGETALSAACTYSDPHVRARMVRYLLEQGADPNMADTAGRTALMRAVHQRVGVHVTSLLLKHGADPAHKDYSGESALTRALLHALREEHEREDGLDQDSEQHHTQTTVSDQDLETDTRTSEKPPHQGEGPDRATLQLLLEECERRGQQVVILTCCSQGAHRTIRQYHHAPPERHHCPPERNYERNHERNYEKNYERNHERNYERNHERNHERNQERNYERNHERNHERNQERNYERNYEKNHERNYEKNYGKQPRGEKVSPFDPPGPAPQAPTDPPAPVQAPPPRPQISINGLAPSDPAPTGPTPCDLAASPSDVDVVSAHGEGVFSFNLAPPRPRPPRVLKRLNSEPWGLSVPKVLAPPTTQDEAEVQKPLSLVDCPQRRHSIETHESALSDALKLTEQLTLTQEPPAEERAEPTTALHDSERGAPEDEALQSLRRRGNLPPPFCGSSSENLSNSSSPLVTRRGRQGAGLLERRGSGTLLLDHLSQPRPFLPPLFNPQRPIPDLRSANPAPCASGPAPRRKKLLRRHSMQPEQMKLLSAFQHVLSENEEK